MISVAKPQILDVKKFGSATTSIKFSPNLPPLSDTSLYKINSYYIQSCCNDQEWVTIHEKEADCLPLVEEVLIESRLSRRCEYRVVLCYDNQIVGEVKSDTYSTQLLESCGKLLPTCL